MPQAFDNCNVASLTNDIGGEGPITENFTYGLTVVTWTATDFDGNSTSVEQEINILVPLDDCNNNGTPDVCELEDGTAEDCDGNGVPDRSCDLASGTGQDCNNSGVLDSCEVASGGAGTVMEMVLRTSAILTVMAMEALMLAISTVVQVSIATPMALLTSVT